jgi:hypothetical protein
MNTFRIWAYYAFAQDETAVGQSLLRQAVSLDPSLLSGQPSALLQFMVNNGAYDSGVELEEHSAKIVGQLPSELSSLGSHLESALARAYLMKATSSTMFGRLEEGREWLSRAVSRGANVDQLIIHDLTHQLLAHRLEFGEDATRTVLEQLALVLDTVERGTGRWLKGNYYVNRAFQNYRGGRLAKVPGDVAKAIVQHPPYLWNRGVMAILCRSTFGLGLQSAD